MSSGEKSKLTISYFFSALLCPFYWQTCNDWQTCNVCFWNLYTGKQGIKKKKKITIRIMTTQSFWIHSNDSGSSFICYFKTIWKQHNVISLLILPRTWKLLPLRISINTTFFIVGNKWSRKSTITDCNRQ